VLNSLQHRLRYSKAKQVLVLAALMSLNWL
jgi:hypothetical protein